MGERWKDTDDTGLTRFRETASELAGDEAIEVHYDYRPDVDYAWVSETDIVRALKQRYRRYRLRDKLCYRRTPMGQKEFLLEKPPGNRKAGSDGTV